MRLVQARAIKIPPSAIRPVVTRDIYPPPPVVRSAPPPVPPPVARPVAAPVAAMANQAAIPETTLRRAIRHELREMRLNQAPARTQAWERTQDRAQERADRAQARVQDRLEYLDNQDGGFDADPWGDGFGDENELTPAGATPGGAAPAVQPMVQVAQPTPAAPQVSPMAPLQQGAPQTAIVVSDGYGPLAQMSRHLRIQAADGYRAGVIRLKNGMHLVVEIAQEALAPEFGVAEVLAPLVFNAAAKALEDPDTQKALMNAASHGVDAVGKGIHHLTHQPQRRKVAPKARPVARPVARPATPAAAPYYGPWPGFYLPPGYTLMQQGGVPMAVPMAQAAPQRIQAPLRQEALPWADDQDFAGLFDEGDDYYSY